MLDKYLLSVCLLIVFFFDEIFYTDLKQTSKFRDYIDVTEISEMVWRGPISNPMYRRSVFNPSFIFDSSKNVWHLVARFTRGRRLAQCIWQYVLDDDLIQIDGREHRSTIMYYQLDRNFNVLHEERVFVETEPYPGATPIDQLFWQGEDPRIYRDENGKIKVQATVHQNDGVIKLAQGTLKYKEDLLTWNINRIIQSPLSEKNWGALPLNHKGRQLFLDKVSPEWSVVTLDEKGNKNQVLKTEKFAKWFGKLRCTSACRPFRDGTLLTCLHTVHPYRTILCELSCKTLLPLRISRPLEFKTPDAYIEFPSGLEILDGNVFFGLGFNDTYFEIRKVPLVEVDNLLTITLSD